MVEGLVATTSNLKHFLFIYAGFVGFVLFFEAFFFFHQETGLLFESIYHAITNVVKSFTMDFEPTFFPSESLELSALRGWVYTLAMFSAPFCTFLAGLKLYHNAFLITRKKTKHTHIIFGHTKRSRLLVENTPSNVRTYLFTDEILDKEQLATFYKQNCLVKEHNPKQHEKLLQNTDHIFLLEEDSLKNAVTYINTAHSNQENPLKFYAFCSEEAAVNLIKGYHDEENRRLESEVQIINVDQMKLDHLFTHYPLITDDAIQSKEFDVHALVVGFDNLCKQAIFHILNEGVMDTKSTIQIQIVYENDDDKERFLNYFATDFIQNNFTAYNKRLEGNLEINFHKQTTLSREFLTEITKDVPLTYSIVNMGDVAKNIYAASLIKDFTSSTIAINFSSQDEISRYFQTNSKFYSNFVTFLTDNEVMHSETICDDTLLNAQKEYNFWYEKLAGVFSTYLCEDTLEESWAKLNFYKKESCCFAYYHKKCKLRIIPSNLKEQISTLVGKDTLDILLSGENVILDTVDAAEIIRKLKDNKELYELMSLEHRRWNYFAATQGRTYGEKKDDTKKETPYLTSFDDLCEKRPDIACYDLLGYLTFCQ